MNLFHYLWDLIKEEVLYIVEYLRSRRGVLKSFNATFLALILKEEGAENPCKFRPVVLCNDLQNNFKGDRE